MARLYIISDFQLATIEETLSDARSFYEMFDGWEGVPERAQNVDKANAVLEDVVPFSALEECLIQRL